MLTDCCEGLLSGSTSIKIPVGGKADRMLLLVLSQLGRCFEGVRGRCRDGDGVEEWT